MKSDFRAKKSLAADIGRIELSLTKNKENLLTFMTNIKDNTSVLSDYNSKLNGLEIKESLYSYSTSMRDAIDSLENDMISIEGIDIFDIKTSPDSVIESLRKLKDYTRKFDSSVENHIKLIIKSKGNGEFIEDFENGERSINMTIKNSNELTNSLVESLNNILTEVDYMKEHSKDLLKNKIL